MALRALLTSLVLVPFLAQPVLAQLPAKPESRKSEAQAELQRLVQRIQEGRDRRGIAFARLVRKGPKAAVQVAQAVDVAKPAAAVRLLQVLGEMGPDAIEAVDVLEKRPGPPRVRRDACCTTRW